MRYARSMASKTRTRLSPANRIDQLLDVAKQMIVSDGLQSFTIESLARLAAVSSPLVYNYFSSRQALLQALLEREYRVSGSALLAEVVNANSFEEVIRIFIANIAAPIVLVFYKLLLKDKKSAILTFYKYQ